MSNKKEDRRHQQHMTTSIGRSGNTKYKNKHKRRMRKKYRGQGK